MKNSVYVLIKILYNENKLINIQKKSYTTIMSKRSWGSFTAHMPKFHSAVRLTSQNKVWPLHVIDPHLK